MRVRTCNETYAAFVPARKTWIAYDEDEGKVMAYATAETKPNKNGYIDIRAAYVLTEYQGMGVCGRLVEGVIGEKIVER
jgi:predicted GNAT family acetyltransferase